VGRLGDVTLGELARAIARYRPAAVALVVLLVALQLLPDRTPRVLPLAERQAGRGVVEAEAAGGPDVAPDDDGADEDGSGAPGDEDDFSFGEDDVAFDDGDDSFGEEGFFDDEESFEDEDFSYEDEDDSSFGDEDGSSFGDGEEGASLEDDVVLPLSVMEYGWATATAGTPVASSEVPEGTMPVGRRIGQDDKISFVRLIGTERVLELHEASDGQRTPPLGTIGVRLCQSTDANWTGGDAQTFDDAPAYATDQCAAGQRSDDGVWRFDLGSFADVEDHRGFVLVPAEDAAVDFQVAFEPH
jgi:hypothetical protein